MRIVFRADASKEIGTGHVMRLSALAEEAILRGYECIFIGQISDLEWVNQRIDSLGFQSVFTNQEEYAPDPDKDILIIDSYTLGTDIAFLSKSNWKSIVSIIDSHTPKYNSDLEVHPKIARVPSSSSLGHVLSGPEYLLMRKDIKKWASIPSSHENLRVLILGGGSDVNGFAKSLTKILSNFDLAMELHVFGDISIKSTHDLTVKEYPYGNGLDKIASNIDLVLTTASTSSLEFIAREIPVGIACAVENQVELYNELIHLGYAVGIGSISNSKSLEFDLRNLKELVFSDVVREKLKIQTKGLIDLQGVKRVLDQIENLVS